VVVFAGGHSSKAGMPLNYAPSSAVDIFTINSNCVSQCGSGNCTGPFPCYSTMNMPMAIAFAQGKIHTI
jgi:hypothetical protein